MSTFYLQLKCNPQYTLKALGVLTTMFLDQLLFSISGGGKSTVVKMLERFYDPVSGSVKLDGVDIKDINLKHFRSLIGYVGQEPTLFATSIAKNIKYGNPSATQEQIEEAARLANAHDFISSFPDKYDTNVGDKGEFFFLFYYSSA